MSDTQNGGGESEIDLFLVVRYTAWMKGHGDSVQRGKRRPFKVPHNQRGI